MAAALKDAKKPFELVTLAGEDHWLSKNTTRQQMLEAVVTFVEKQPAKIDGAGFTARLISRILEKLPANAEESEMVPGRGLEPPRPYERQHLKLVRLPIPPSGHGCMFVIR